jgi:hypothetical protein
MFSADDLTKRVRQRPFVPLRIVTSAGEQYDVRHPDLIMVGRRDIAVGTASTENPEHYDQLTRIAIMHVSALQDLPASSQSGGNGQG